MELRWYIQKHTDDEGIQTETKTLQYHTHIGWFDIPEVREEKTSPEVRKAQLQAYLAEKENQDRQLIQVERFRRARMEGMK